MKRTKKIMFVHGTRTTSEAEEILNLIVGMVRRQVEEDEHTDWEIEVAGEEECVRRLDARHLGGYVLVFNSKSQIGLARMATHLHHGRPARVIVMTGDVPQDEVVFVRKSDTPEVLTLAVRW